MAKNLSAKTRIRVGHRKFLLFKCQLSTCCNFITSFTSNHNKKYCFSHQNHYQFLPQIKDFLKTQIGKVQ